MASAKTLPSPAIGFLRALVLFMVPQKVRFDVSLVIGDLLSLFSRFYRKCGLVTDYGQCRPTCVRSKLVGERKAEMKRGAMRHGIVLILFIILFLSYNSPLPMLCC